MIVQLPDLFMALAFKAPPTAAGDDQLRDSQLEECRITTIEYLLPRLQVTYPRLSHVDVTYQDLEWGTGKPEAKFQAYWKANVSMTFVSSIEDQTEPVPGPTILFDSTGELFRKAHYLEFLRERAKGKSKLLTTATEVQVGLLPKAMEGGAVQAPNFYMGFVCDTPPTKHPSPQELERLRKYVFPIMVQMIRNAYVSSFDEKEGMTLKVIKSEINEKAGKPVETYNLYIEFEATGIFHQDAPPPMQFYAALASFSLQEFLPGVIGLGGCFNHVTQMAINPCAWIDDLSNDVKDPMSLGDMVPVHVEFWLALVLPDIKSVPNSQQVAVFDEMMKEFLHKTLVAAYGNHNYQVIELHRESCEYEAHVPLPRFNILHRFQADIFFNNPIPTPDHVLSKIMRCDVGTLIGKIGILPAPWDDTTEGTLGNAMFQKMSAETVYEGRMSDKVPKATPPPAQPQPQPQPAPPQPKPAPLQPKPAPKVEPKPTPPVPCQPPVLKKFAPAQIPKVVLKPCPPPSPPKKASPKLIPKVAPKPVAPKPPPPAKKAEPEPVVPQVTIPAPAPIHVPPPPVVKSQPPAPKPTPQPTTPPMTTIAPPIKAATRTDAQAAAPPVPSLEPADSLELWAEIFVALTIQDDSEPTPAQYEQLAKVTQSFYSRFLSKRYGKDTFENISVSVRATKYNSGIPEPKYNCYVEWDIKANFKQSTGKAPDRMQFCQALASEIDMFAYLKDRIREIKKTPFANSIAIYTEQVNTTKQ